MEETAAQPADWLPYRARPSFNLFELACLLHRQDPERLKSKVFREYLADHRALGHGLDLLTPQRCASLVDALPEQRLGDAIGGTLKALKKAAAAPTMQISVTTQEAQRLAAALGLSWPQELGQVSEPERPARRLVKKATLITKLRDRWEGIESDLSNAQRNGLAQAAAAENQRGYYDEDAAIRWAMAAGKMQADDDIRAHRLR